MCSSGITYFYLRPAAYASPLSLHLQIYRGRGGVCVLYVQSLQCSSDPAKTESGAVLCELSRSATFILYIISHTWLHTPNCHSPTEHRLPGMIIFSYKVAAMTISLWNTTCLTAAPGNEISGCGETFSDLPILWSPCNYL